MHYSASRGENVENVFYTDVSNNCIIVYCGKRQIGSYVHKVIELSFFYTYVSNNCHSLMTSVNQIVPWFSFFLTLLNISAIRNLFAYLTH